jgi:cell division protein FtsW
MARRKIDKPLLFVSCALVLFGLLVFTSAVFGLSAQKEGTVLWMFIKQAISLIIGLGLFVVGYHTPITTWRKYAFHIFVASCAITLLVFIPGLGIRSGGASRWIEIGSFSLQPAEFLKLGYVLYLAALFTAHQKKIATVAFGLGPFLAITAVVAVILLKQPNTGIFVVTALAGVCLYMIAGGRWKHFALISTAGILVLGFLIVTRPYVLDRFETFFRPSVASQQNEGYQIRQSLIAVGSGGVFGRGLGQSIQKFSYLPEPIGDSIFAVLSEELGFLGSVFTVLLFSVFALLGFKVAARVTDMFSRLVASGIVILITGQSFLNIAAILNLFPLSGIPILFISQGGTALMFALLELGILLNISRYQEH